MIKFNIKTVSAEEYQDIETKRCAFTNTNYSDLLRSFKRNPNLPLIDLWANYKTITSEEREEGIKEAKERELKLGIKPVFYKPLIIKAKFK